MDQPGESPLESFLLDSAERGRRPLPGWRRVVLLLVVLLVLLGWYWSLEPDAPQLAQLPAVRGQVSLPAGVATTAMLEATVQALFDKPGGFIGNDVLPPGVWLDNMAAFERGVMVASRDLVRAMRRDFSHSAAVSLEDPDLQRAEPRFFFEGDQWLSTEGEYREGLAALESYRLRLAAKPAGAHFFARADGLSRWLADVDDRLNAYGRRLARVSAPDASAADRSDTPASWSQIDDAFYEARGYAWALQAQQAAIGVDFAEVLRTADAGALHRDVIAALAGTQKPIRSPLILNGSEYGVLANHSLVMAGYLARARAAIAQWRVRMAAD